MTDWGRTLDEIMDGMTYPQFSLLTKMRHRRILGERQWDLQLAGLHIQTKEQGEAWGQLAEQLDAMQRGKTSGAVDEGGTVWEPSSRYPLLHELTPEQVARDPQLRKIVRFRKVKDESG